MSRSLLSQIAVCLVSMSLLLKAAPVQATERFVLLIDGSGSMWGQVDGKAKISILRTALESVLGQLDTQSEVGIVAFGHREKGNCADIEEILPPTPFDAGLIRSAIANIQPKGKTPLSDGVRFAAQSQRFTEDKATVIILGDGRESCGRDPCAVAEELEALGVDLTVHAIAFDIADEEGTRQLQCFAEKTGGMFLPAADSTELVAALEAVREEVAPEPEPVPEPVAIEMTFRPVDAQSGDPINQAIDWTFVNRASGDKTAKPGRTGPLVLALAPGDYAARITVNGITGEVPFTVAQAGTTTFVVPVALPQPEPVLAEVSFEPVNAKTGAPFDLAIDWTITSLSSAKSVARPGVTGRFTLPLLPGNYTARISFTGFTGDVAFSVGSANAVTLKVPIAPPEPTQVILNAFDAITGEPIPGPLAWTFVNFATEEIIDFTGGTNETREIPPGEYEVYVQVGDALGETRIAVPEARITEVVISVAVETSSPLSANGESFSAGSAVEISWALKGRNNDIVFIAPVTQKPNSYPLDDWRRHVVGTTVSATLTAPPTPGDYEIRYFSKDAGGLVHRLPIKVTPVQGALQGPPTVTAGDQVSVAWSGPAVPGDFIFIAPVGWNANQYPIGGDGKASVKNGSPLSLKVPETNGPHEYRYFSAGGGRALFTAPVEVVLPDAFVKGPASAAAGSELRVDFRGPRIKGDRIFIAKASMAKNRYTLGSAATDAVNRGSPAKLVAPATPGDYEIRYFSTEKGGLLARARLSVTEAIVILETPRVVTRAADFSVRVQGPYAPGDFVFVARGGMKDNSYPGSKKQRLAPGPGGNGFLDDEGYYRFNTIAPAKPGRYEVRYYSKANGSVLARRALIVK